jgi:hypothetical protein
VTSLGSANFNGTYAANGQNTLTLYGQQNAYSTVISGYNGSGSSFGLEVTAGFTGSDSSLYILNRAANSSQFQVFGNGFMTMNASQNVTAAGSVLVMYCMPQYGFQAVGYNATNQSCGEYVVAGTSNADYACTFYNRASSVLIIQGRGDGYAGFGGGLQVNNNLQGGQFYGVNAPNIANASGQLIAYSHPTWSSINNKSDVQPVAEDGGRSALDLVHAIRGVRYQHHQGVIHMDDPTKGAAGYRVEHVYTPQVGFIGEEVVQELPEVGSRMDGQLMGIDYGKMVPVLWEAVKELTAMVQALQKQVGGTAQ